MNCNRRNDESRAIYRADRAAARARQPEARERAMKRAKVWYQQGTKPFFIAKRLTELGYRVSERTVRRWVETTGPSEEK